MIICFSSILFIVCSCVGIAKQQTDENQAESHPNYPDSKGERIDYAHQLRGENPMDWSGNAISTEGDFDGDGRLDILIGAMKSDEGHHGAGKVYLVTAAELTDPEYDLADAISFSADEPGACAGASVAFFPDRDEDGRDEILIGSPCNNKIHLFFAQSVDQNNRLSDADRTYRGQEAGDYLGWSAANIGDANGDGKGDVLIGADGADNLAGSAGKAMLISYIGPPSDQPIDIGDVSAELWGEKSNEKSGNAVAGKGDVDGDGLMDMLIGAKGSQDGGVDSGKAYLATGEAIWSTGIHHLSYFARVFVGEAHDKAGAAVAFGGDIDGDGLDDILIGAPNDGIFENRLGKTYVVFANALGSADLRQATTRIQGLFARDHSGFSVTRAGDINQDGHEDILIGSPSLYENEHGGQAHVVDGAVVAAGGTLSLQDSRLVFKGGHQANKMGYAVSFAGQSTNDKSTLVIGSPGHGDSEEGRIFVLNIGNWEEM